MGRVALSVALLLVLTARSAFAQEQQQQQDEQPAQPAPGTEEQPGLPKDAPGAAIVGNGGPVPGADTHGTPLPEDVRKPASRPFTGSSLFNQNSMSTGTLFRGQTLSYNPTVESTLYVLPRYAINEAFQLRGRVIVSYEYTNNDESTFRNEPILSDSQLQLYYRKIPKVLGFQPYVAANLSLPTSKLSRSRTMIVSPGATLQIARDWEHALGGTLSLIATTSYSHPFYTSRNPEVTDDRPNTFSCVGGNNCQDLVSGTMNPSDTLSYAAILGMQWGKWEPALMYLGASQWAYHPKEISNPVDGTPVESAPGFEPTTVRQTHYVSAWLDYDFNTWFTGEVGFWNATSGIDNDGKRANLLFDRYQDTRVYLGCSIQLDNLVQQLSGKGEGEPGVVRAKNEKGPALSL